MDRFTNKRAHIDVLDDYTQEYIMDDVNMEKEDCGAEILEQVDEPKGVEQVNQPFVLWRLTFLPLHVVRYHGLFYYHIPKRSMGQYSVHFSSTSLKSTNGWSTAS